MALYHVIRQDNVCLGIWKMEESVSQLLQLLDAPDTYAQQLARFSFEGRKIEWLSVRVLCHALLGHDCSIAYYPSGKPYLPEGGYISISHTRGYVAVIFHPTLEVGVDIEQYGERVKRVSRRFMDAEELNHVPADQEIYSLLLHWSAKETIYKVMNQQEVDFANHIHLHPFAVSEEGQLVGAESRTLSGHTYQIHYLTHPNFVLTWTVVQS